MKNLRDCFKTALHPNYASLGLLVVRLIMGTAFILHGWGKIQTPFVWMGPDSPVPGIFQFLAAVSEFGGGIALILGFLIPLASIGLAFTMGTAVYFHMFVKGDPFVGTGGPSYELALVYLGNAILFLLIGPGMFSMDYKLFGEKD